MDPESIRAEKWRVESETDGEVRDTQRELGSERADALSQTTSEITLGGSMQSSASVEARGLLSLFLNPGFLFLFLFLFLDLSSTGLDLGSGRAGPWTVFHSMTSSSTEQAQVVIELSLSFLRG